MYQTASLKNRILFFLAFLSACTAKENKPALPYYNTPDFTPLFLHSLQEVAAKVPHTIPSFSFTDQQGKIISDKNVEGKIHVASFIFTKCGSICPVMIKNIKLLQNEFKNSSNVELLSFSVTPWIDSVPQLKKYAGDNDITAPNWHLLTGDKASIYLLARQGYFAEEDIGFTKDSTEFLHTEHIILADKTKRIRGIYNGTLQLEAEQLIKDIKLLLQE